MSRRWAVVGATFARRKAAHTGPILQVPASRALTAHNDRAGKCCQFQLESRLESASPMVAPLCGLCVWRPCLHRKGTSKSVRLDGAESPVQPGLSLTAWRTILEPAWRSLLCACFGSLLFAARQVLVQLLFCFITATSILRNSLLLPLAQLVAVYRPLSRSPALTGRQTTRERDERARL